MGGKDLQYLAVFCDRATGDLDSLALECFNQRLITQRLLEIFFLYQIPDPLYDAFLGFSLAVFGFKFLREETFIGDRALRGLEIFPVDGTADRGFVKIQFFGDVFKT